MLVTVHSIYDAETRENINYGINDSGYDKAMADLNSGKYADAKRYEYFGYTMEIRFVWDMNNKEFDELMAPGLDSRGNDITEYLGAVFFGDFKLEFHWNDVAGSFNELFFFGAEFTEGRAYGYLEDNTPYEELTEVDEEFHIRKRRTFDGFAKSIESQVIDWLNRHPDYIEYALELTIPSKWYPGEKENYMKDFTRIA